MTCSGLRPSDLGGEVWSTVWNWLPAQISALAGAAARSSRSMRLHRRVRQVGEVELGLDHLRRLRRARPPHLPAARLDRPGSPTTPAVILDDLGRGAQLRRAACPKSTVSASRPPMADQVSVASTATPEGICTTSTTPGTAFA